MKHYKKTLVALGLFSAFTTQAAELNVNGFASIVAGKQVSSEKLPNGGESNYLITPTLYSHSDGSINDEAYYSDDISFTPDSTLGLQFTADMGEGLSVTAQLLAHGADGFKPEFEWAYLSYQATEEVTINVGRQRIPLYMYSDFLDVGYAYHWLRAPSEVYEVTLSRYEGISVNHSTYAGDWEIATQAYYGNASDDRETALMSKLTGLYGVNSTFTNDWAKYRISYNHAPKAVSANSTNMLYKDGDNMSASFLSAGAHFTIGEGFVGTEITRFFGEETLTLKPGEVGTDNIQSFLITAGYRFGDITPHITYARNENKLASHDMNGDGVVAPVFQALNGEKDIRETVTVGARWDFHDSAAMKVEYNHAMDKSSDTIQTIFGEANTASIFSVGVDVIF